MNRTSNRRDRKAKRQPSLGPVQRAAVGAAIILVLLSAGWGGYELGLRDVNTPRERLLDSLQALFDAERRALDGEKRRANEHLDALAQKMGQMQGEILRLDALGERLVEMGDLDATEFDFSTEPAMGGPLSDTDRSAGVAEMMADLDALAKRIEDRELKLGMLEHLLLSRRVREETKPEGRPVAAGWISSLYGWRRDPFTGKKHMHQGLDYAGPKGTEIIAVADGLVTLAEWRSGYGKTVEIRHGNGYMTRYAHNSKLLVKVGDLVRQGQPIATMGSTGRATGVHLHFEVLHDGKSMDPLRFVKAQEQPNQG